MKRSIFIILLLASSWLTSCAKQASPPAGVAVTGKVVNVSGGSYTEVSPAELSSMLANKDFTLVNVHTPFDGNIAQTDLSIPYDQVAQNLARLPAKDARIVLYCRSGRMSAIAAATLVSLGYTNIWDLSGGMAAWEAAGYTIQR